MTEKISWAFQSWIPIVEGIEQEIDYCLLCTKQDIAATEQMKK